jgi:large subunit ribosomal protein L9
MKGRAYMKVILTQDVQGSGKKGDIVKVSDGYARNFLLKRGMCVEANDANMKQINAKKAAEAKKTQQEKDEAAARKKELEGKTIKVLAKAGENGKLFGSVTAQEIAEAVKKQLGYEADKRKITFEDEIKKYGTYEAEMKLYSGITAKFYVLVGAE